MKLLEKLSQIPGVPGREHRLRDFITSEVESLVDETRVDALGSLVGKVNAKPKGKKKSDKAPLKIMLAAHMDQIGFLVRHIDDKGFLRVQAVGGFDTRNLFARLVTICTEEGDLTGVLNPGGKPVHIASDEDKKKIPEISDLVVDMGLAPEEVKQKVKVGDMVVLQAPFTRIGNCAVAQAMDNRVACWVVIEALRKLKHHNCEIYPVWTVQEEVGCIGAGPAAFGIQPDLAISLDTTLCCDTPGVPDEMRVTQQGQGVGIHMADSSMISDIGLINDLEKIARERGIAHQRCILPRGGNDAATILRKGPGFRVATLVCPTRYIHTVTEMIHLDDLHAMRDLVAAYLETA